MSPFNLDAGFHSIFFPQVLCSNSVMLYYKSSIVLLDVPFKISDIGWFFNTTLLDSTYR